MQANLKGRAFTTEEKVRHDLIVGILQRNEFVLRDDSALAYHYIKDGGDVSLVAHEILSVNYLHQHTQYAQHCTDGLRQMANMVKQTYNLSWTMTWDLVREYGVPALKMWSLAEHGSSMPFFDVRVLDSDMND